MKKEIVDYLEWLKNNNYITNYRIEDYYVILEYGLFNVGFTERNIEFSEDTDIISFLNTILISASQVGSDIYECLVDENDFYGYSSEEELEERIEEEEEYLKILVYDYKECVLNDN